MSLRYMLYIAAATSAALPVVAVDNAPPSGETDVPPVEATSLPISVSAYADIETTYLCRGIVWDTHPISTQEIDLGLDAGPFGHFSAYVWDLLQKSPASHADGQSYRCNEIDYGLRYSYDLELAKDWNLDSRGLDRRALSHEPLSAGNRTHLHCTRVPSA